MDRPIKIQHNSVGLWLSLLHFCSSHHFSMSSAIDWRSMLFKCLWRALCLILIEQAFALNGPSPARQLSPLARPDQTTPAIAARAFSFNGSAGPMDDPGDFAALVDLYTFTNGDRWFESENWLSPGTSMCTWQYVWCDNYSTSAGSCCCGQATANGSDVVSIPCRVVRIELNDKGLSGSLPASIGNLSALRLLFLQGNSIRGPIPATISNCVSLANLQMSFNQFTSIPDSLFGMANLTQLYLASNLFSGTIPSRFGQINNIRELDLSSNAFSGEIPIEYRALTRLTSLKLDFNLLNGSVADIFGNMSDLIYLHFAGNMLKGSIPASIGLLPLLEDLVLDSNHLSGALPEFNGSRCSLFFLDASRNEFTGTVPATLCQCRGLHRVDLFSNRLSGSLPSNIGALLNLKYLDLSYNSLSGSIPASVGNMTGLTTVDLSFNGLTGSLPATMFALKSTTKIQLQNNALSGMLPRGMFAGMLALELLNLSTNGFSGELPRDLSGMLALNVLDISSNQFNGDVADILIPPFTPALFRLAGNLFSGKIPSFPRWLQNISTQRAKNRFRWRFISLIDAGTDFDSSVNRFDCPLPLYDQAETLFIHGTCRPEYELFSTWLASAAGVCIVLFAGHRGWLVWQQRRGGDTLIQADSSIGNGILPPEDSPTVMSAASISVSLRFWAGVAVAIFSIAVDAITMTRMVLYLSSEVDSCSQMNNQYSVWKAMSPSNQPGVPLTDPTEIIGAISFNSFMLRFMNDVWSQISVFDVATADGFATNYVKTFVDLCHSINSGCSVRRDPTFPAEYAVVTATECYMSDAGQARFGGSAHRLFASLVLAIAIARIVIEALRLGAAIILCIRRFCCQPRVHFRGGSVDDAAPSILEADIRRFPGLLDFVMSSAYSPLLWPAFGSYAVFYSKAIVYQPTHRDLLVRLVVGSVLCSLPLLAANLYFLFAVVQSGIQTIQIGSALSGIGSVIVTLARAFFAWRRRDPSFSDVEMAANVNRDGDVATSAWQQETSGGIEDVSAVGSAPPTLGVAVADSDSVAAVSAVG